MYFTGIDQHRRSSSLTTVTADGTVVGQARLANEPHRLLAYCRQFVGPHAAVVEATGRWYWMRDLLQPAGVDLRLAHAKFLKAIAYAKVKTDAVDSRTLGQLLRTGFIPEAHMISEELRGPRDLLRTRLRLVQRRVSALNSVDRLLEKFNVEAVEQLPALYQVAAQAHAAQIAVLADQIRLLERTLRKLLLGNPAIERLRTIPGIGRVCALTIYLEIDGIERFPSLRHFWSYCRLVPGAADSGPTRRHRSGSKDGNRYLKIAFSHAAVRAVQHYPEIRTWYRRWKRKKLPAVARALVAKELAKSVYMVLQKQEAFHQRFKGTLLTQQKQEPGGPARRAPLPN